MRKGLVAAIAAVAFVGGCSDDSNNDVGGHMKLAVADAPVDGATQVVVAFTGVELTGNGMDDVNIDFPSPKTIDLINDSGKASAVLFDSPVPAGSYGQIRLKLQTPIPEHSYMMKSDGQHPLNVPSGSETGLKLVSGFTVPDSGIADYTIDFDLRKAITCPPGHAPQCTLKPALRLVRNDQVGNIAGTIDPALTPEGCTPAVYLYSGTVSQPQDNNSGSTSASQPVASTVPDDASHYQFTFLAPGTYTVAFTCDAAQDDPESDDSGAMTFSPIDPDVTVAAGATTTEDLAPAP